MMRRGVARKRSTTVGGATRRVAGNEIRAENFQNNPAAVARIFSSEAAFRFRSRRSYPCERMLTNGVLAEFVQIILQLAIGVEEPRAHGPFGNTQDFTDLGVWHSLNVKHRDDRPVFIRQLHHRLVQSSLELAEVGLAHRAARGSQLEEFLVV